MPINLIIRNPLDRDAREFFARANISDAAARTQLNGFVRGVKQLGLWDSMVCWPLRSTQNAGTGTAAFSLGGLGTYVGTLVNGPTWGTAGITTTASASSYIATAAPFGSTPFPDSTSIWVGTLTAGGTNRRLIGSNSGSVAVISANGTTSPVELRLVESIPVAISAGFVPFGQKTSIFAVASTTSGYTAYKDGNFVVNASSAGKTFATANLFINGASNPPDATVSCAIFLSKALTASEVASLNTLISQNAL